MEVQRILQILQIIPYKYYMYMYLYLYSRGPSVLNLPSYLRHNRAAASTWTKRPRVVQSWDKDIICLPQYLGNRGAVKYPRGKYCARLGTLGLMGKIHIVEDMTVEQVAAEVRSVFKMPMNNRSDFPFQYLQPTGSGSRTLSVPSVSSSFNWTAKQVARLGGTTGTFYILAGDVTRSANCQGDPDYPGDVIIEQNEELFKQDDDLAAQEPSPILPTAE